MDPLTGTLGIGAIVLCLAMAWLSWTAASKTAEAKHEKERADGLAKDVKNLEKALEFVRKGGTDLDAIDRILAEDDGVLPGPDDSTATRSD